MRFYTITYQGHSEPIGFFITSNGDDADGSATCIEFSDCSEQIYATSNRKEAEKRATEKGEWYNGYVNPYAGAPFVINEHEI